MHRTENRTGREAKTGPADWVREFERQVRSLRFGVVQVVVHDAKVVQIEKTERTRYEVPA